MRSISGLSPAEETHFARDCRRIREQTISVTDIARLFFSDWKESKAIISVFYSSHPLVNHLLARDDKILTPPRTMARWNKCLPSIDTLAFPSGENKRKQNKLPAVIPSALRSYGIVEIVNWSTFANRNSSNVNVLQRCLDILVLHDHYLQNCPKCVFFK